VKVLLSYRRYGDQLAWQVLILINLPARLNELNNVVACYSPACNRIRREAVVVDTDEHTFLKPAARQGHDKVGSWETSTVWL